MRTLESAVTRKSLQPVIPEPQPGDGPGDAVGRGAIRRIVVTAFAIALMTGLGLMLMDLAIDKLSSRSFLRLSGLF